MRQKTNGWDPAKRVSEQAPGVHFVEGPASNWIVVRDGPGFILIDSGYPGDRHHVLASLRHLGLEPADALALLLTHGHVDHTGSAAFFSESYGTPVLCAAGELAHVQGKEKHQVTLGQVLSRAWRPRVFRWIVHVIKAGALAARPATQATAWDAATLRALPGRPVAISVPGHTPGNTQSCFRKREPSRSAIRLSAGTRSAGSPVRKCCIRCITQIRARRSPPCETWPASTLWLSCRDMVRPCACRWTKQ
ncbi:MBL fold metallo-hydrolase [Arthrobacter sp. B2I5]|uniref:MBL fold metallo-hydrolase n=1 Tax=Arthrobacter sp. B2I5 TaxID=3042266 RepID=UPI0027D8DE84|nr:MBL fold metallo-hydrolase [Arthrobacter sp. B2I5]